MVPEDLRFFMTFLSHFFVCLCVCMCTAAVRLNTKFAVLNDLFEPMDPHRRQTFCNYVYHWAVRAGCNQSCWTEW